MRRETLSRLFTAGCLVLLGLLGAMNVSAAVDANSAVAASASYSWKHVANQVYHCTSTGSAACDTPSSHLWPD